MFAARDDHVLFFDADDEVEYGFAVQVMDQARDGGAVTIAPLIKKLEPRPGAPPAGSNRIALPRRVERSRAPRRRSRARERPMAV